MSIIPTSSAIATAVKNAQRDASNYRLNDLNAEVGLWILTHKKDATRNYTVDTIAGNCECIANKNFGICKHQVIVDEEVRIREMEAFYDLQAPHCIAAGKF